MRTFVLLLVFAMPPLVACGVAHANASGDIGKPICSHYDDSTKTAEAHAPADGVASTASPAAVAATTSTAQTPAAPTTAAPTGAAKSGGTASMSHPRSGPHWQTFLPGMFR
jgi:hypothetical protein